MDSNIVPRIARGCLYFQVGPILFQSFAAAAAAWSAAEAHRVDILGRGL